MFSHLHSEQSHEKIEHYLKSWWFHDAERLHVILVIYSKLAFKGHTWHMSFLSNIERSLKGNLISFGISNHTNCNMNIKLL